MEAEDFRRRYLLSKLWRTDGEKWTCDAIDYWTSIEDAIDMQMDWDETESRQMREDS